MQFFEKADVSFFRHGAADFAKVATLGGPAQNAGRGHTKPKPSDYGLPANRTESTQLEPGAG